MPLVVREIKTVSESLPRPAAHWRENRPAFFTQLALYCHGLSQIPAHTKRGVTGVLVLAEPATGIIQEVPLDGAPSAWLAPRASRFARFAESRWNSRLRLEHLRLLNPFAESRAEWDVAAGQLAAENAPAILLEAPTGFGKTSLALVDALHHLRDGEVSRIVYVTGKNSGRLQVLRELSRLTEPGALRALTLHSRAEHEVAGVPREPEVWVQNWRRAAIDPGALFDSGETELAAVRALGERVGVPPWEITKTLLPLAELILCDYNYVFSPWQAGVLGGMDGWDPAATLLIADEAHNLPERAAEARSIVCDAARAADALDALRYAGVRGGWLREWEAWAEFLAALPQANALEPLALYLARDHCAEITRLWEEQNPLHYELPQDTIDALERPAQLLPILEASPENYFFWSPRPRCFRAACLDAAVETGETLRAFHRAVLMSATLSPPNDFAEAVGLSLAASANTPPTAPPSRPPTALAPPDSVFLSVAAPWRFDAYEVAADVRVDTRLKSRERHFRATAESVLSLAAAEPAAVFFPSFAYAETIKTYIAALDSGFQVFVQPRGATPDENAAFLTEALLLAHAIFLVAGGGLAESVDMLGGRITRAMVVSPCLPEVSAERAAKMALRERAGDGDPFRSAYLLPALRKVNQALGRLVRAPDQRAKVVLHCRRFADPNLAALLAPEYRGGRLIRNAHEWAEFTA
jgi:Rad3-related DNA helicase